MCSLDPSPGFSAEVLEETITSSSLRSQRGPVPRGQKEHCRGFQGPPACSVAIFGPYLLCFVPRALRVNRTGVLSSGRQGADKGLTADSCTPQRAGAVARGAPRREKSPSHSESGVEQGHCPADTDAPGWLGTALEPPVSTHPCPAAALPVGLRGRSRCSLHPPAPATPADMEQAGMGMPPAAWTGKTHKHQHEGRPQGAGGPDPGDQRLPG